MEDDLYEQWLSYYNKAGPGEGGSRYTPHSTFYSLVCLLHCSHQMFSTFTFQICHKTNKYGSVQELRSS